MVGKSNKFDFSNRSNSGNPLAQVISDAFEKELEKAKKDAARQAKKFSRSGIVTSKDIGIHVIDFKVPHKELGDEGVGIMVKGMERAVNGSTKEASLSLQHINLKDNSITALGCFKLSTLLDTTTSTIKTVDLSDNAITIENDEDLRHWECFVRVVARFRPTCIVDLSGNRHLGAKAWEVFARVCAQEKAHGVHKIKELGNGAHELYIVSKEDGELDADEETLSESAAKSHSYQRSIAKPGIPVLHIADTGLDDAGALWLSYLLPATISTRHTEAAANADTEGQHVTTADHTEWQLAGESLGKEGLQLLRWVDHLATRSSSDTSQSSNRTPTSVPRRASGRQSVSSEVDASDIIVLRHRMQRQIIHQLGVKHVQLWHATLVCLNMSRKLLLMAHARGKHHHRCDTKGMADLHFADVFSPSKAAPRVLRITNAAHNGNGHSVLPSLPIVSKHLTSKADVAGSNAGDEEDLSPLSTISAKLTDLALTPCKSQAYMMWQARRLEQRPYRDQQTACGLSNELFRKILVRINGDSYTSKLSDTQLDKVYRWGQDRTTLATEREWIKMTESAQILTLLDNVRALAYEE